LKSDTKYGISAMVRRFSLHPFEIQPFKDPLCWSC
jgi:hypothetical protein